MSLPCKFERSLLDYEEFEKIRDTHHPYIYDLDADKLRDLQVILRDMRGKERTMARQKQREVRGKSEERGGSFPGVAKLPQQRKQVFAAALKRVNKELKRQRKIETKAENVDAAKRSLRLRREASYQHWPSSQTADEGMTSLPSRKGQKSLNIKFRAHPARIGAISQMGKNFQAKKDARS